MKSWLERAGSIGAVVAAAAQALVVLALVRWLLGAALVGGAVVFAGLHLVGPEWLAYLGLAGLVAASLPELWARTRNPWRPAWNRK